MEQKILSLKDDKIVSEVELFEYPVELRGGRNLLDKSLMRVTTGEVEISDEESIIYNLNGTFKRKWVWFIGSKLVQNTKYILSFKIKKTSGNIVTMGGHFTNIKNTNVFRDGELQAGNWHDPHSYPNDDLEHRYDIYFERTVDNGTDLLYIQPNRTEYADAYTALIYDLQIVSGNKPMLDWTPAPEDLGLSYPDWVTEFKPSISENGILIGSFTENPNI